MRGKTIQKAFEQLLQVVVRDGKSVLDMEDGDGQDRRTRLGGGRGTGGGEVRTILAQKELQRVRGNLGLANKNKHLTIPRISSASVERSSVAMRRLLTWITSRLLQQGIIMSHRNERRNTRIRGATPILFQTNLAAFVLE